MVWTVQGSCSELWLCGIFHQGTFAGVTGIPTALFAAPMS